MAELAPPSAAVTSRAGDHAPSERTVPVGFSPRLWRVGH
jgi:hypothetical protein